MPRTVTLLGAGASREAGPPTSVELLAQIRSMLDSRMSALFDFVASGIAMRQASDTIRGQATPGPNIEDVANAISALAAREESDLVPFVAAWHPFLENVDLPARVPSSAASEVATILQQQFVSASRGATDTIELSWLDLSRRLIAAVNTPRISGELLANLKAELPKHVAAVIGASTKPDESGYLEPLLNLPGPDGQATVGSLNYDLTLEACCRMKGSKYSDYFDEWLAGDTLDCPNNVVRIYKVHGSLDWEVRDGNVFRRRESDIHSPMPAIIFGGHNKLKLDGPYLSLLWGWRGALLRADSLLVVGYSFGDEHINAVISEWCRQTGRGMRKRIVVVDPGFSEPGSRFKEKMQVRARGPIGQEGVPGLDAVSVQWINAVASRGIAEAVRTLTAT